MASNRALKITLIVLILLLVAALGAIGYFYFLAPDGFSFSDEQSGEDIVDNATFAEGITLDNINLAGMTYDEALEKIDEENQKKLTGDAINIFLDDKTETIAAASKILIASNANDVLNEAILLGNQGKRKERQEERDRIAAEGLHLATTLEFIGDDLEEDIRLAAQNLSYPAVDATVEIDLELPEKFKFSDSVEGRQVDADKLFELVKAQITSGMIGQPIEAPSEVIAPAVTVDQLKAENTLVSSFYTSFAKSSLSNANRVHNISKASGLINGVILQPGEEFDMNKTLGDRSYETGWKGANGIRAGRYETEAGGGVCQVSTTLFNAVVMADLQVTDRKPHSWPLSYVAAGRDATISTGGPNFKFKNNKDTTIIIVSHTDTKAKKIYVEIYGKPLPDGMKIELTTKKTGGIPKKETEYVLDPSMAPGTTEVYRESHVGSTHELYKEYYVGDKLIKSELAFKSVYPSIGEIVYHGPLLPEVTNEIPSVATDS